jgi:hypothetical protein
VDCLALACMHLVDPPVVFVPGLKVAAGQGAHAVASLRLARFNVGFVARPSPPKIAHDLLYCLFWDVLGHCRGAIWGHCYV